MVTTSPSRIKSSFSLPMSLRCSSCTHLIHKSSQLHFFNVKFTPEAPQHPTPSISGKAENSDEDQEAAANAQFLRSRFNPYYYKRKSYHLKCNDCQANITLEQDLRTLNYSIVSGASVEPSCAENEDSEGYGKKFVDKESLEDMALE